LHPATFSKAGCADRVGVVMLYTFTYDIPVDLYVVWRGQNWAINWTSSIGPIQVCVLGVVWLRRLVAGLSTRRPLFSPRSTHVGFVVDKVTLGQVFLRVTCLGLIQRHRAT
jgi:hypothetical protein